MGNRRIGWGLVALSVLPLLAVMLMGAAVVAPPPYKHSMFTTNATSGTFTNGQVGVWDATNKQWIAGSAGSGSSSGVASVPQLNGTSSNLMNVGPFTNTGTVYLDTTASASLSSVGGQLLLTGNTEPLLLITSDFDGTQGVFPGAGSTFDLGSSETRWNYIRCLTADMSDSILLNGATLTGDGAGGFLPGGPVLPTTDNTSSYTLGSSSNRWYALHVMSHNVYGGALMSSAAPTTDTSTTTNYWESGAAYPLATSVTSGGQLRLSGGLSPARIAVTNWNRFTNSICTNVISTVDGVFTVYATNGAAGGMWTNGASLVTCATNLATNINAALFFGSALRVSNYVNVVASGSNVLFYPLGKCEGITCGSVTNGATNLNATANAIVAQPVSGNFGIGTNNPATQYQQRALTGNGSAIFQIVNSSGATTLFSVSDTGVITGGQLDIGSGHQVSMNYVNNGDLMVQSAGHIGFAGAAATTARSTSFGMARPGAIYITNDNTTAVGPMIPGIFLVDQTAYTNLNGTPTTFTNLGPVIIPANMLTNNGDRVVCRWEVDQQFTKVNTNEFKLVIGGNTVLDSGLQITSNGTVYVCCQLTRNSANSIRVSGKEGGLDWTATIGRPFPTTNIIATSYALDTGTNNTIALQGSAQAVGAFTNRLTTAEFFPRP